MEENGEIKKQFKELERKIIGKLSNV